MEANPQITILVALVAFVGVMFGAIFSFVGVAITAFFTSRNNNKNIFINAVTNERAKWREGPDYVGTIKVPEAGTWNVEVNASRNGQLLGSYHARLNAQ